jgi:subtilisin-like proprotein convertase family protein
MERIFRILIILGVLAGWFPAHSAASQASAQSDSRMLVDTGDAQALAEVQATGAKKLADYSAFSLWQLPASSKALSHRPSVMPVDDTIRFRGLAYKPGSPLSIPAQLRQDTPGAEGLWIVQFPGPILPEWLESVQSAGLELVTYLPENAYLVWGSHPDEKALKITGPGKPAHWNGAYHPYYRLSPELRASADSGDGGSVDVTVQIYTTSRLKDSLNRLAGIAEQVLQSSYPVLHLTNIRVRVPVKALAEIAGWPDVINIETYRPPEKMDEAQGQILAGNVNTDGGVLAPTGPGYLAWLDTKGFSTDPSQYPIVDVVDDGLDAGDAGAILHPDFHQFGQLALPDRVSYITNCTSDSTGNAIGGHGNLNAGILAGYNALTGLPYQDSAGYHLGLGISPYGPVSATKIFNNQGGPDISNCEYSDARVVNQSYSNGARITSNSWGVPGSGQYDAYDQEYDAFTRDASPSLGNQEMLHIFAAGNSGSFQESMNSPASAKNVLSVGATENVRDNGVLDGCYESTADNANDIAHYSSRGPAADGRAKPEIVAPGTHVQGPASQDPGYTGNSVCGGLYGAPYYPANQTLYTWSTGTSHSTPAISGVAQLVYAYYQKTFKPGSSPSPAMVKALILNTPRYLTGLDAGGTLPGTGQGWGSADMGQIFDGSPRILVDQSQVFTATGQSYNILGQVSDPSKPFHVSLVWTDAPGSTASASAAVNNLDLEVTIGGVKYLGNVFSGANSVTGGKADTLNNVESAFLPAGTQGAFHVRVIARNIAGDGIPGTGSLTDQDFALVVYNGTASSMPFIAVHDTAWTQISGNHDWAIDPGETINLQVSLENQGSAAAANVSANLVTNSPLINIITGTVAYPDIPAGGTQAGSQSFQLHIDPAFPCQGYLPLSLDVTYNNTSDHFPIQTLALGMTIRHHYTSTAPPVAIPDDNGITPGMAAIPLMIPDSYSIADLDVAVDITHTFVGDLTLQVVSPDGLIRTLSKNNGSSEDNYHNTIFDDQAETPVISGTAPFTGRYQPEQTLDAYNTRQVNGTWNLIVLDNYRGDTGTVWEFSIDAAGMYCNATKQIYIPLSTNLYP